MEGVSNSSLHILLEDEGPFYDLVDEAQGPESAYFIELRKFRSVVSCAEISDIYAIEVCKEFKDPNYCNIIRLYHT